MNDHLPTEALPAPARLSGFVRLLRILAFLPLIFCVLVFLSGGTPQSRTLYTLALLLGLLNPVWSLYALALLGGLYLNSSGSFYLNTLVDALAIGALMGELRLLGRVDREFLLDPHLLRGADPLAPDVGRRLKVAWGAWPAVGIGVVLLVWAAAVPSFIYSVFEETNDFGVSWVRYTTHKMLWGWESDVQFGLRAACNWTVGMGLLAVAARRATAFRVARFFKLGAIGLLACCAAGLLEVACQKMGVRWFALTELRAANLHPWQAGRFQATAGHAGWFGQWILVFWPGVVLLGLDGGWRRRVLAGGALLLVLFCLILTGARAAWLGMLAAAGALGMFLLLARLVRIRTLLVWLLVGAGLLVVLGGLAYLAGGEVLGERMLRTLNFSGRENYFSSGAIMLRQFPLGIGLGQHFIQYHTWFTNVTYLYFQHDHVTAHNFLLHLLIENGPFLPLVVFGGVTFLFAEFLRVWPALAPEHRILALLPVLVLVGLMADGVAQYFFYIRVIEYSFWIVAGLGLGLYRRYVPRADTMGSCWVARGMLVATGVGAILTASAHFNRPLIDAYPRVWDVACDSETGNCFNARWTAKSARFPIEPNAVAVQFTLYRRGLPARVLITWPDGERQVLDMHAEAWVPLKKDLEPIDHYPGRFETRRWVRIDTDVTYTPARWETGSTDKRPLGVYINELFVWFPWHLPPAAE